MSKFDNATRRQALTIAIGATTLALSAERALAKASLKASRYQNKPNDGNSCGNCKVFQPPSECSLVEGPVSRNGWCALWIAS